jgi:hypothetical protein
MIRQAVPATKINAAVLETRRSAFLAFTFIVISRLSMSEAVVEAPSE